MKSKLPLASQMGERHIYVFCYAKTIAGRTHAKPVGALFMGGNGRHKNFSRVFSGIALIVYHTHVIPVL